MITVVIIGLVVSIATPMFIRYRESAQQQICIENLSQIESAKQQWGMEHNMSSGAPVLSADIFGTDKWIKFTPDCPGGGIFTVGDVGVTLATCTSHLTDTRCDPLYCFNQLFQLCADNSEVSCQKNKSEAQGHNGNHHSRLEG
ncbi:MAG TPA: hypothetical protein EYQ50_14395 [Verrucomicrobiales bacterium]|nr:hypothetical protein [Verrucomicrobiales bacterium]HIL70294.1 hypothetical protein [Verrucomicrobiota bacterium]